MTFEERFGMSGMTMLTIILGVFMAVLDSAVVNVAIPKMMSVFATTQDMIEWVITAYLLTTGMLTPASGWIGDRFGQKKVYAFALFVFTLGSALCGAAVSVETLIAARVVQAIGGALLIPVSMAILFSMAKPDKRGLIMGLWGIAIMFAPAFGPTLSGYIVQYLDYRLIFYINVPIGIINLFMVRSYVPAFPRKETEAFDLPGFISSVIGFFALLYALSDAPSSGWTSVKIISLFIISGISLALFVVFELTTDNPMLDLRLLKIRIFFVSAISISLISMAMMGALFVLPLFLQNGLGLSPLKTGLLTMPGALVTAVLMPISGTLFDKIGARPLAIVGLGIMLLASYLLTNLNVEWSFTMIMLVYMIRAAGMGLSTMPISTAGMNSVPLPLVSRATALQNTLRNVAGSIGTAILSTAMQNHMNDAFITYSLNVNTLSLQQTASYGIRPSVFGATSSAQVLQLLTVLKQLAFQGGAQFAIKVSIIMTVAALVSVVFIGKKARPVSTAGGHEPVTAK